MQHRKRKAFNALYYPHDVSTSMKKIIGLLVKTPKNLLWQEVKTHLLGNNHDKVLPSLEIPVSQPPREKKPFMIPRLLE
jgi:hypothetical protein